MVSDSLNLPSVKDSMTLPHLSIKTSNIGQQHVSSPFKIDQTRMK